MLFPAPSLAPRRRRMTAPLLAIPLVSMALAGCSSVAQDVRDYYRQMEHNYNEAKEKAKVEAMSLEGESRMLATSGEFQKYRRAQRELERIKAWEERCGKQEERFQKAAVWTEDHFHLQHPPSARQPDAAREGISAAPSATSETKDPS